MKDPKNEIEYYEKKINGPINKIVFNWNIGENINIIQSEGLLLVLSDVFMKLPVYKYKIATRYGGKRFCSDLETLFNYEYRSYTDINEFIDKEENNQKNHYENEIIFNKDIPIEFLKEIWICEPYRTNKPTKFKKDNLKLCKYVSKLLETHNIKIPVKIVHTLNLKIEL